MALLLVVENRINRWTIIRILLVQTWRLVNGIAPGMGTCPIFCGTIERPSSSRPGVRGVHYADNCILKFFRLILMYLMPGMVEQK